MKEWGWWMYKKRGGKEGVRCHEEADDTCFEKIKKAGRNENKRNMDGESKRRNVRNDRSK